MLSTIVRLAPPERRELNRRIRARSARAEEARRAELILRLAQGESYSTIRAALRCGQSYISRWKQRFVAERLAGLYSRHRGRAAHKESATLAACILDCTRRPPSDGATHWSTRKLAKKLGLNHMRVARVWRSAGLRPHRMRRYMQSDDPFFEAKAAQIIGLYLRPPPMRRYFAWTKKVLSRRWIDSIRCCRFLRVGPNATALNITGMVRSRFSPLWRSALEKSPARLRSAIPAPSLSLSWRTWWLINRLGARFISSPITSRLIRPNG